MTVDTVSSTKTGSSPRRQLYGRSPRCHDKTSRTVPRREGQGTALERFPRITARRCTISRPRWRARTVSPPATRRKGAELVAKRLPDRPSRVLEPDRARESHASPGASVQFDEPRLAVAVAKHLEHEQPRPFEATQHALGACPHGIVQGNGDARARPRACRVHHPDPAVSAPGQDTICRREPEHALADSQQPGLHHERAAGIERIQGPVQFSGVGARPSSTRR